MRCRGAVPTFAKHLDRPELTESSWPPPETAGPPSRSRDCDTRSQGALFGERPETPRAGSRARRRADRRALRRRGVTGHGPLPDREYGDDRRWTCGDREVSEWTIRGTHLTGEHIEVRGCDLFEFTDGKISRKDSFWKIID
jgi:ketosteroid isomerase-like protein